MNNCSYKVSPFGLFWHLTVSVPIRRRCNWHFFIQVWSLYSHTTVDERTRSHFTCRAFVSRFRNTHRCMQSSSRIPHTTVFGFGIMVVWMTAICLLCSGTFLLMVCNIIDGGVALMEENSDRRKNKLIIFKQSLIFSTLVSLFEFLYFQ